LSAAFGYHIAERLPVTFLIGADEFSHAYFEGM
jgi:hypothetical protein